MAISTRPRIRKISSATSTRPTNLPMMNCRRVSGLESTVSAVRPSISSATETLAVQTTTSRERTLTSVRPLSLSIFTSSPNVLYGMTMKAASSTAPTISATVKIGWPIASFVVAEATAATRRGTSRNRE